ncbi:carboxypeptidase-like regulatory domain-containing protein [Lacinutrix sp.]|uniref:carboxypeptidase-like regulatory domain-containing protein n=1 Tax=Lacinutrix sp. TaxID=1937692 RepID=UPI0025BA5098|nr:carboxypeptidase-like regulatory domain-containing protein [Lacinutrix sp.]
MKNILLFISFFFISFFVEGQSLNGKVIDAISQKPLIYANIALNTKDKGVASNEDGFFLFPEIEKYKKDSLIISYLGYQTKIVAIESFLLSKSNIIPLKPETSSLDEVILEVKKARYTSENKLKIKHKGLFSSSVPFGSENVTYIENEKGKDGKVEKVILSFKEKKESSIKTYKAFFRVKFFEKQDSLFNPGKLLCYENIIVKPLNKTYKIIIDLKEFNIKFPKNGIIVGLETINPEPKAPSNSMYVVAPTLVKSHTNKPFSWSRYRGKQWYLNKRKSPFKKKYYTSLFIGLKVKYKKDEK